ncbi:hypothetical protein HNY73_002153 [Argiope bruennichi]|uniref:Uncharacterized protein n=1 Tax=Argiope bruennichi TaxID=94029 RepID=A0A8T0FZ40_ARGBR|nr:hypothetical protein HNY73_002153 [Argiope bruennichi]
MKFFVLLVFIPSLITATNLCPDNKTPCPENKQCCEIDGIYSCCDPDDDHDTPATRLKVYPGDEIMSSTTFGNTSSLTNDSKLHYDLYECNFFTCSGKCCSGGCCGALEKCCGTGCCSYNAACCGTWCCKAGYRCGSRHLSCRSKGFAIYPGIIVLLSMAASVFLFHRL